MYVWYCDICNLPVKIGEAKYILAINKDAVKEYEAEKVYMTIEEVAQRIKESKDKIKIYEICKSCKEVLDRFLNLRIKEVRTIQQELKQLDGEENDKGQNS